MTMPVRSEPDHASPTQRAASARARAAWRLTGEMDDLFLPDDARLDERMRLALATRLHETIGAIETELRRQAARLLAARGASAQAEELLTAPVGLAAERLTRAGLLRDEALIGELIAQVRDALLSEALPATNSNEDVSLVVRLAGIPDRVVAGAAQMLLVADSKAAAVLPADMQHRLVWWVAAAIRPAMPDAGADRAIAEAATRSLSAYDDSVRAEAIAVRLASAIEARHDELAPLLLEALGDRRLSLFTAVLAGAIGIDFEQARALVQEPEGERLWLALRAIQLDRPTIARIALTLSDADPRRDIEAFADELDRITAIEPAEARLALAPETLDRDFRAAIAALARSSRR